MAVILVVDDDADLALMLRHALVLEGYDAAVAHDAASAVETFRSVAPQLVVLDLILPDGTGADVITQIRKHSDVPILMLSAVHQEQAVVGALDAGADDYITKPFSPAQLMARIRAALRRQMQAPKSNGVLASGTLLLDPHRRDVLCGGQHVALTPTEFTLLQYLLSNVGRVLTFNQIVERVWGFDSNGNENLVRIHVSRLRKKLSEASNDPPRIVNHPRVGYSIATN